MTARRVLDMDAKRAKSLAYVPNLTTGERNEALNRIRENALVVAWVQRSLNERARPIAMRLSAWSLPRRFRWRPMPSAL